MVEKKVIYSDTSKKLEISNVYESIILNESFLNDIHPGHKHVLALSTVNTELEWQHNIENLISDFVMMAPKTPLVESMHQFIQQ